MHCSCWNADDLDEVQEYWNMLGSINGGRRMIVQDIFREAYRGIWGTLTPEELCAHDDIDCLPQDFVRRLIDLFRTIPRQHNGWTFKGLPGS